MIYFVFILMLHLHVAWWHVQLGQLQSISPSDTLACSWWSTKELWYGLKYKIFLFIKKTVWGRLREWSMVTKEEEWGEGIVREFGMDMYTLLYLKWIINKDLLVAQGTLLSVMRQPSPLVWGRRGTCICMAESLHCSPEAIRTLSIGYTPV